MVSKHVRLHNPFAKLNASAHIMNNMQEKELTETLEGKMRNFSHSNVMISGLRLTTHPNVNIPRYVLFR